MAEQSTGKELAWQISGAVDDLEKDIDSLSVIIQKLSEDAEDADGSAEIFREHFRRMKRAILLLLGDSGDIVEEIKDAIKGLTDRDLPG